jgi:hypothetical protein
MGFFSANLILIAPILGVCGDVKFPDVAQAAWNTVVNLSAMEHTAVERELISKGAVKLAVSTVLNPTCVYADEAAMALRNLTRSEDGTKALLACDVPGVYKLPSLHP